MNSVELKKLIETAILIVVIETKIRFFSICPLLLKESLFQSYTFLRGFIDGLNHKLRSDYFVPLCFLYFVEHICVSDSAVSETHPQILYFLRHVKGLLQQLLVFFDDCLHVNFFFPKLLSEDTHYVQLAIVLQDAV